MTWSDLLLRLRALVVWRQVEHELDEELRFHIEMQTRKNVEAGMNMGEAARRARVQFGGVEQAKENCRDARGIGWIETLLQDVRYALRGFRRTPGFALTVIATIALRPGAQHNAVHDFQRVRAAARGGARSLQPVLIPLDDQEGRGPAAHLARVPGLPQTEPGVFRSDGRLFFVRACGRASAVRRIRDGELLPYARSRGGFWQNASARG